MKKINDFSQYTNILPYASEIFGVYKPLLGWKSKKIRERMEEGFANDINRVFSSLYGNFKSQFEIALNEDRSLQEIKFVEPASIDAPEPGLTGSYVIDSIASELPPLSAYKDDVWDHVIQAGRLTNTLTTVIVPRCMEWYQATGEQHHRTGRGQDDVLNNRMVADQLNRESVISGYLLYLKANNQLDQLKDIFYKPNNHIARFLHLLTFQDPLDVLDPFKDIDRAGLSPIGIVHLFRQYFFEFDTFLGSPVSHVWLSPNATVELIEINTRKTLTERSVESTFETTVKAEKTLTEQEEISDAVKEDNKSETKFGMNATVKQGWIGGEASASASIAMNTTQSKAREVTHKHMRQQTDKLSTEIRKNFKSTFKTVTEVTDTSSKRYVLNNTTPELINYELRRKMRQVGVQIQDIGTYLCWQAYVDDPGRQLGIAKLVHVAKDPEVGSSPAPEQPPMPENILTDLPIDIPFVPLTEDTVPEDDMDEEYRHGKEKNLEDVGEGDPERIKWIFPGQVVNCQQPGYQFLDLKFDYGGNDVELRKPEIVEDPLGKIEFTIHVDHINFHDKSPIRVTAKVTWRPTQAVIDEINTKHLQKVNEYNEKTKYEFEKAFVEAARDRINQASNVEQRKFEDLREEERIVVYRSLIQDMLTKDISMPDDRTRHVVSELLNTIFDIDKMLYFVAPEFWRPRLHHSHQGLGGIRMPSGNGAASGVADGATGTIHGQLVELATQDTISSLLDAWKNTHASVLDTTENTQIASTDTVTWGGMNDSRVDNYYITDKSEPAKLGSSLGWLLQLDGDNLRNAFLNAPWVKAVIPVRPGKERAATNWLQRLHVEGTDGLDDNYVAPPEELAEIPHSGDAVTLRDAINHLCDVVAKKHEESMKVNKYPTDEINDDNRVSATPVDKVYEHGFYPLQGGFRVMPEEDKDFEVFDQWVEVLPTDQVVPVEVTYDPKTGRQL